MLSEIRIDLPLLEMAGTFSCQETAPWEIVMQDSVLYVVDRQHENLILEFGFCVPDPRIAAISSLFCTKQYNGNAETRMNDLISFHFKRLAFSPSLGPLASSGPPGVPSPLSKTANVPYFTRHLEMS